VFLSAFSAFYISVTAVTDDAYRGAFFTGVMEELERSIAVRAAYNAVRRIREGADDSTLRLPTGEHERPV
jgi:hypothetical protein